MSKSPAMINKAKRVPEAILKLKFRNKDYNNVVPIRPIKTVKQFLNTFAENFSREKMNYKDLELYTSNPSEMIPYEEKMDPDFFKSKYKLFYSNLTPNGFAARVGIENKENFNIVEVNEIGELDSRKSNFFSYLVDKCQKFKVSKSEVQSLVSVKNVFNVEAALRQIEENKANYQNPWLYNKHTFSNVSLLNYSEWDQIFYKNLLTQILNSLTTFKNELIFDIDTYVKGVETKEKQVDLLIKSKDNSTLIPLNIVKGIDEVQIYNETLHSFYDYSFPKMYPMFLYELVNPNNPADLTSDVLKMVENVNTAGAKYFRSLFLTQFFKKFENGSFRNLDTLKTLSRNRYCLLKHVHIGISSHNDKLRFNLYRRPYSRGLEDILSVHRSEIFDLGFDLNTLTIKNSQQFADFLSIFNVLTNLSPLEVDDHYENFITSSGIDELYSNFLIKEKSEEEGEEELNENPKHKPVYKYLG